MNKKFFTTVLLTIGLSVSFVACSKVPAETTSVATTQESVAPTEASETSTQATVPLAPIIVDTPTPYPYVDTVAPFFLKITRNPSITVGDEFSIDDYISYIDNTDPNVALIVDGSVSVLIRLT